MPIRACVFDAYGTLLDVGAAARRAAGEPGREALAEKLGTLAEIWRLKQLQYTWLRAVADHHADFWQVTQDGLDYALEALELDEPELRERLLALYWELEAFPEVPAVLAELNEAGQTTAILSNGSPDMLKAATDSAGISETLDAVISVQDVGVFKPHRTVYALVEQRLGVAPGEVLFVSSNCWDACAGAGFGFVSAWVNRRSEPCDRLPWRPKHTLDTLTAIPEIARRP
ncbi:MAG TPA: haloacid dehalogenase type II [Thermohalobaculum sp.]|nr:haloacid dehalogenase type II [Thermohalobaculum sp.]